MGPPWRRAWLRSAVAVSQYIAARLDGDGRIRQKPGGARQPRRSAVGRLIPGASAIRSDPLPAPFTCTGDINNARAFITNTLPGQLDALYAQIQTRAPNAQVIVVGYPRLFNGEQCNLGARISPAEQSALNGVADLLVTRISGVATAHGFDYVDPRIPFDPHRVCADIEWLNGLSNPVSESYHPNRLGHDAFTDLVAAKL